MYWIARAFGLELPWTAYLFQVVFLGFLLVLSSTLGIRGTYQAGMVVALGFYAVVREQKNARITGERLRRTEERLRRSR